MYYRVYKASGAVRSKQPASSNDPSVGRISVDSVPPPHTAISVMRCISKIEQLSNPDESQLFVDISSEFPIGEGQFSILTSDRPGSTQEDPIVLVEAPCPTFTMRMRVTSTQGVSKFTSRKIYRTHLHLRAQRPKSRLVSDYRGRDTTYLSRFTSASTRRWVQGFPTAYII